MQVEMLKQKALIDIKLSTGFIRRLHNLMTWMINSQDPQVVQAANENIEQGRELSEWEEHYMTLLGLISDTEDAAREQGFIEVVDVPEPVLS